jgi:hypothetical protein
MPVPVLPVVAAGADAAAAVALVVALDVVELVELDVALELEVLSAVVDAVEALPAYDAAAT